MIKVVGVGEMATSINKNITLKTYALASCVAVVAYYPKQHASGLLHIVLPAPNKEADKVDRPYYFAKTGIPLFISSMCNKYGCLKEELEIRLYGGANSSCRLDSFHIGEKNIEEVKHALKKLHLFVKEEDLGGSYSRTLEIEVNTGSVKVLSLPLICK